MTEVHKGEDVMNKKREDVMNNVFLALGITVIIVATISAVIISTQFSQTLNRKPPYQRGIIYVSVTLEVNSSEVQEIDDQYARELLMSRNMSFHNRSEVVSPDPDLLYSVGDDTNPNMYIGIWFNSTLKKSWISASDTSFIWENELPEKKVYLQQRVEDVADACNLTLNWMQAHWGVSYQD
jgi:hypothetical protein